MIKFIEKIVLLSEIKNLKKIIAKFKMTLKEKISQYTFITFNSLQAMLVNDDAFDVFPFKLFSSRRDILKT